ncbi:methionine adenosyltransferase [Pyruvatibacter sp.]|uniref:methionine adenosyltransferase n=1 Tax=Pyruvatibacter sp. TaxID=1981328 RepID=UPI0032EFD28B
MARSSYLFTSESVSEGHPDKVCDRVSDEIVDLIFRTAADEGMDASLVRVAAETLTTTNKVVIAGEVRVPDSLHGDGDRVKPAPFEEVARAAIRDIGYEQDGFHWKNADVDVLLHAQSVDIAQGVDAAGNKDEGAGDQGIMFGYACRESDVLMPAPIVFSHRILKSLADARHADAKSGLGPDSKSQVTLRYENGKPVAATSVVVSTQHDEGLTTEQVREIVRPHVLDVLPDGWMCPEEEFYVNPTGKFVIGGPDGDAGLTGRKIIVDTYGGAAPHGGGAFSGKDPTKVDRSAAYAARYVAKNVVAAGFADKCTLQLAYAIGVSKPLSVYVDLHGTGNVDEAKLEAAIQEAMNLSPRGIREHLALNKAIYARSAAYGHFGRDADADGGFSWEKTDLVEPLKAALS